MQVSTDLCHPTILESEYQEQFIEEQYAYQGIIYQFGGSNNRGVKSANVIKFHPRENAWLPGASMLSARVDFGVAIEKNNIFVVGGLSHDNQALSCVDMFDVHTERWTPLPRMMTRRSTAGACCIDGKLYVCGGNFQSAPLNNVEAFVPEREFWAILPNMKLQRSRVRVHEFEHALFAVGGMGHYQSKYSGEMLDVRLEKWMDIAPPLSPLQYCSSCIHQGRIYCISEGNFQAYDIVAGRWMDCGQPPKSDYFMQTVAFCNTMVCMGGSKTLSSLDAVNTVTVYSFEHNLWMQGMPLPEGCTNHGSVVGYPDLIF